MRHDKCIWMERIAEDAETAAQKQHVKTLYTITKTLSNEKPKRIAAICDKQGKTLQDKVSKNRRWLEHFKEVLNRESPINPISEEDIIPTVVIEEIDVSTPLESEIKEVFKNLKSGKASGVDRIPTEFLQVDIEFATKVVIWTEERVPNRWKKGLIFKLPKKGNLHHCENWQGNTLLPIISKVLSGITISVEAKLREEQAAYVHGWGTTEHIFILRNIIEQSMEWQTLLYVHFVDFEKAIQFHS